MTEELPIPEENKEELEERLLDDLVQAKTFKDEDVSSTFLKWLEKATLECTTPHETAELMLRAAELCVSGASYSQAKGFALQAQQIALNNPELKDSDVGFQIAEMANRMLEDIATKDKTTPEK